MLDTKGLFVKSVNDNREYEDHTLHFYERNPAGQRLEFDDSPDDKPDFVRYAVELRCQKTVAYRETTLPPLEDLAEATTALLIAGLLLDKEPRKDLNKLFLASRGLHEWFPSATGPCR